VEVKQMDAPDEIVRIEGAGKRYGTVQALDRVDLSIRRGEVRALLGKNGAGKSTLIRLIGGVEAPDQGRVTVGGTVLERPTVQLAHRLGVRTVYQELTLIPEMSVAENLFMGEWPTRYGRLDRSELLTRSRAALRRLDLGFDPRRPVGELSIADRQLVEIARAVVTEPAVLILDEPTSSLAAAEVDRVLALVETIRSHGVAVIYVSHRLAEIRRVADTATVMRDGAVIATEPVSGMSTADVVRMMLGEERLASTAVSRPPDAGPVVMQVRGVAAAPKLRDVSFDVHAGEVLGIAGVLGSGRTELLQVMSGQLAPDQGSVLMDGHRVDGRGFARAKRLGIGMTPEDRKRDGIVPDLGVDENLVLTDWRKVAGWGILRRRSVAAATADAIASMSVRTRSTRTPIAQLSGGNQQKVVIGRWLHAGSRLLLLDEPTRGVDVQAKSQIYDLVRALAARGTAVVVVSSELEELGRMCGRSVVLAGGRVVEEQTAPGIETERLLEAAMAGAESKEPQ
jgi:ABC-type sugar transport system ATPase subunit